MAKVSVIGAGNVGATCAYTAAQMGFANEVVLLDVREGFSEGKAIDMLQSAKIFHNRTKVVGTTNDYSKTAKSDVVVITSGIPRKPGMSREDLIGTNANIMNSVISNVIKYSPKAKIIVVANPMDTMTYLAVKKSGIPANRIIGMGGMLDSCRFNYYISQTLKISSSDIDGIVIGGHSDTTMVPLMSLVTNKGAKIKASKAQKEKIISQTMVGGATLTKLIGTSAWYAPGACAAALARAVVLDEKRTLPCCVYLNGEYGESDICIGVPAVIGKNGVEKVVTMEISKEEKAKFKTSVEAVRKTNSILKELGII